MKKSSGLMTFAGILTAVSSGMVGIPIAVATYYAQIVKSGPPDWWNACIFPMVLFGTVGAMVGTAIMGVVGKGQDEHSTTPQIQAATQKAEAVQAEVIAAKPAEPVVEVKPPKP